MNKISTYFQRVLQRADGKSDLANWTQLQQSTVIVLVATLVITAIVWVMDFCQAASFKIHLFIIFIMETNTNTNIQYRRHQKETKWYVLRVVSGKERKVKEYLDKEISRGGWGEMVKQVFLPVEKVYKVQNGKKVMRERNYYPGYVMIEVTEGKLGDDLRDAIKNTTNVIHFLGKGKSDCPAQS